jgi:hypothetical protein
LTPFQETERRRHGDYPEDCFLVKHLRQGFVAKTRGARDPGDAESEEVVVVMRIEIKDVTSDNFNDIPSPSPRVNCKACDYWEGGTSLSGPDDLVKAETKQARIAQGVIGAKILYADGRAVGYCQYGKLSAFARSLSCQIMREIKI